MFCFTFDTDAALACIELRGKAHLWNILRYIAKVLSMYSREVVLPKEEEKGLRIAAHSGDIDHSNQRSRLFMLMTVAVPVTPVAANVSTGSVPAQVTAWCHSRS